MGYFVSLVLLLVGIIEYERYKNWIAPSVCFCVFWSLISFFASLRLYNLNSVELRTWFVIIVGVLSFVCGTKIKLKKRYVKLTNTQISYISTKVFWVLFSIVGIYTAIEINQTLRLLQMNYSLSLIRDASFGVVEIEGYVYRHGTYASILRELVYAIETLLIAVGIELYLKNTKKNWIYILSAIYLVIGKSVSAGGRWILLYFLVEFFACRSILRCQGRNKKVVISTKLKRRGIFLSIFLVVILVYVFFRINAERNIKDLGRHLYAYLCGCIPLLDLKIKDIDQNGIYSFIFAGQYGFWSFVIPALRKVTGFSFSLFYETVTHVMTGQEVRNIGLGTFNAFTTGFYYLYADFRYLGVFWGMFVFGIVAGNLFRHAKSNYSSTTLVPYLIISQALIKSIQVYAFESADYVFTFAIIIIIYIFRRCKFRFN